MTQNNKEKEGIQLVCPRCGRGDTNRINPNGEREEPWFYKGKNPFYAPCPHCKTSVNILKQTNPSKKE